MRGYSGRREGGVVLRCFSNLARPKEINGTPASDRERRYAVSDVAEWSFTVHLYPIFIELRRRPIVRQHNVITAAQRKIIRHEECHGWVCPILVEHADHISVAEGKGAAIVLGHVPARTVGAQINGGCK